VSTQSASGIGGNRATVEVTSATLSIPFGHAPA
jgi:hypothetical protein